MTMNEIKEAFLAMSDARKTHMLALLAFNLTICARGVELDRRTDQTMVKKLLALNELQHTVTGQLLHRAAGDPLRYPDDVFMDILLETAQRDYTEKDLLNSFERSCKVC